MKRSIAVLALAASLGSAAALAIPEGPAYPSPAWAAREAQNFARITEAPAEQLSNPAFLSRLTTQSLTNISTLTARDLADPSWVLASSTPVDQLLAALKDPAALSSSLQQVLDEVLNDPEAAVSLSLNTPLTPLCAAYAGPCDGDPYRFAAAVGPDGSTFYGTEATVTQVVFYDSGCARLSGQVWRPKSVPAGTTLPGVVIMNGSVEAPQTAYWWAAQLLVRNGYVVLTFDPRGQGRSDQQTPSGGQGTNINPEVFWTGLVDAIDFFRSSPATPYPNNAACTRYYPTQVAPYNPDYAAIDPARLGIAGHSLGAIGVSVVQGYGAPGAAPWPGKLDKTNPVKAAITWDGLLPPGGASNVGGAADGWVLYMLRQLPLVTPAVEFLMERGLPDFGPRVPTMSEDSEYGLVPTPWLSPPDPDEHRAPEEVWVAAGVPVFDFTIQGSTHYEWSEAPVFPTTSWCPDTSTGACSGGWGSPMMQYYTLAWFDRWLKLSSETGYADADSRLLDDSGAQGGAKMSFYFRSSRDFPDRSGTAHVCTDIRAGCSDTSTPYAGGSSSSSSGGSSSSGSGSSSSSSSSSGGSSSNSSPAADPSSGTGGGAFGPWLLAALGLLAARRYRPSR